MFSNADSEAHAPVTNLKSTIATALAVPALKEVGDALLDSVGTNPDLKLGSFTDAEDDKLIIPHSSPKASPANGTRSDVATRAAEATPNPGTITGTGNATGNDASPSPEIIAMAGNKPSTGATGGASSTATTSTPTGVVDEALKDTKEVVEGTETKASAFTTPATVAVGPKMTVEANMESNVTATDTSPSPKNLYSIFSKTPSKPPALTALGKT